MFRRIFVIILVLVMFLPPVVAQEAQPELLLRPGKSESISFESVATGNASITLQDAGVITCFPCTRCFRWPKASTPLFGMDTRQMVSR